MNTHLPHPFWLVCRPVAVDHSCARVKTAGLNWNAARPTFNIGLRSFWNVKETSIVCSLWSVGPAYSRDFIAALDGMVTAEKARTQGRNTGHPLHIPPLGVLLKKCSGFVYTGPIFFTDLPPLGKLLRTSLRALVRNCEVRIADVPILWRCPL